MATPVLQRAAIGVIACAGLASGTAHALIIDDFSTDQAEISVMPDGPTSASSTAGGAGIVGASRDTVLSTDPETGNTSRLRFDVSGGRARLSADASVPADLLFQWDGNDGNPTLDTFGLGGIDLTDGGASNSIEIGIAEEDATPALFTIEVYDLSGGVSTASAPGVPGAGTVDPASVFLLFSAFSGNADFTNVGAIQLFVEDVLVNGIDLHLDFIRSAEAVPLPAAIWLFASALFGIGAFRRRT